MEDIQPGQVITPNNSPSPDQSGDDTPRPTQSAEAAASPPPSPLPEPIAPRAVSSDTASTPQSVEQSPSPVPDTAVSADPASNWQFQQESSVAVAGTPAPLPEGIGWTASEFTAHDKGSAWYVLILLAGIACAALGYFLTKDVVTVTCIIIAAILLAIAGARKPRSQQYQLSLRGIQVGQRFYAFTDFKTFSIAEETGAVSLVFMPLRRFMPALTVQLEPKTEDQVIDFLSAILPVERHKADAVDGLLRRIRF